jgi:ATP-grasp ribosomal peptide maturase
VTVLVLAQELDRTADGVIAGLTKEAVPVMRLDTSWFPRRLQIDAELDGGRWCGRLRTEHHQVDLEDVWAVWVRTPAAFAMPEGMSIAERDYARREAKLGFGGVLMSLPVLWVNRPDRAATASYKPLQLAAAVRCGLRVSRTLITNMSSAVGRFAGRSAIGIVVKPLGTNLLYEDNTYKMGWTRRLGPDDLADLRGVDVTAHQFQDWVDKSYEARIVAVGDRLFGVGIHARSDAAHVDWRSDYDSLDYDVFEVPDGVASGIRNFMAEFDLRYGAFDFVIGPGEDGGETFTFLECNPGGQYGWLEQTGVSITETLVELLAEGGGR